MPPVDAALKREQPEPFDGEDLVRRVALRDECPGLSPPDQSPRAPDVLRRDTARRASSGPCGLTARSDRRLPWTIEADGLIPSGFVAGDYDIDVVGATLDVVPDETVDYVVCHVSDHCATGTPTFIISGAMKPSSDIVTLKNTLVTSSTSPSASSTAQAL